MTSASARTPYGWYPKQTPGLLAEGLWNRWTIPVAQPFVDSTIAKPYGYFGDTTPTPLSPATMAPPQPSGAAAYMTQAASAVAAYQSAGDPRVQAQVLEARIANYRTMAQKIPIMALFYNNQIAVMQAKLDAIKQNLAIKVEGEDATRDWRSLGQTGVIVGIVGGVAAVALIAVLIARIAKG